MPDREALLRQSLTPDSPPRFKRGELAAESRRRDERAVMALAREAVTIAAANMPGPDRDARQDVAQSAALAAFAATDPTAATDPRHNAATLARDWAEYRDESGRRLPSPAIIAAAKSALAKVTDDRAALLSREAADVYADKPELVAADLAATDTAERRNALEIDGGGRRVTPLPESARRTLARRFAGPGNASVRAALTAALTGATAGELVALKSERVKRPEDMRRKIRRGTAALIERGLVTRSGVASPDVAAVLRATGDHADHSQPLLARRFAAYPLALRPAAALMEAPPARRGAALPALRRSLRRFQAAPPHIARTPGRPALRRDRWARLAAALYPAAPVRRQGPALRRIGEALLRRDTARRLAGD